MSRTSLDTLQKAEANELVIEFIGLKNDMFTPQSHQQPLPHPG